MKTWYLAAILMIALMIGCAKEEAPVAPAAEAPAAPAAAEAPPAPPAAEAPAAPAEEEAPAAPTGFTDDEQKQIDLLKTACERGSLKSCIALKTRFDIEMQPASAE